MYNSVTGEHVGRELHGDAQGRRITFITLDGDRVSFNMTYAADVIRFVGSDTYDANRP